MSFRCDFSMGYVVEWNVAPPSPGKRYWSFLVALNGTFSRGTIVRLQDAFDSWIVYLS